MNGRTAKLINKYMGFKALQESDGEEEVTKGAKRLAKKRWQALSQDEKSKARREMQEELRKIDPGVH